MTKEKLLEHAKSAALTFAATLGVEFYAATEGAQEWGDLTWGPLISAVTFTAARSALKALLAK